MSENIIGKFCALGKKDTLVYPKKYSWIYFS